MAMSAYLPKWTMWLADEIFALAGSWTGVPKVDGEWKKFNLVGESVDLPEKYQKKSISANVIK